MNKKVRKFVSVVSIIAMLMISGGSVWAQTSIGSSDTVTATVGARIEDQSGGWIKSSNGKWWYRYENGQYPKSQVALINGSYYNFDSKGWMTTGWEKIGGNWYFFDRGRGDMQSGWVKDSGKWYYMEDNGIMKTGWKYINGTWYYMYGSGVMATGWEYINGHWYHMASSGAMETGWKKINGHWYYMASSGAMETGWKYIDGHWYYLESNGAMETGWIKKGGSWYYLNGSGVMLTGMIASGGNHYFMSSSGAMAYQYVTKYNSNNFGYPDHQKGTNRPVEIIIHHWGSDGQSFGGVANWLCNPRSEVSAHYVVEDGLVAKLVDHYDAAWHSGSRFHNSHSIGIECRPEMSSGDFNTVAALIANIWEEQGRKLPLLGHKDVAATSCPGRYYPQLEKLTKMAEVIYNKKPHVAGWKVDNIGKFYTYEDGSFPVSTWKNIDGKSYYFDDGGYLATGWELIEGSWYYFNSEGDMQTGWVTVKDKKYYLDENGVMKTGILELDGNVYYFDKNGALIKTESLETKTEEYDYVDYKVIVEKTDSLPEGTSEVKVKGEKGYTVSEYSRTVTKNENGKSEVGEWKYISKKVVPPVDEVVWEGTMKAESEDNTEQEQQSSIAE